MNVLCIGDVVGDAGCRAILKKLPRLKDRLNVDLCIVNGENSAEGNGILPSSADSIFAAGADVITGGNHTLRRREIYDLLDGNDMLLRPQNYPETVPGKGYAVVDSGKCRAAVLNVCGTVYMDALDNPFLTFDRLIDRARNDGIKIIVADFHAEATSEKCAMGFYLDGRVSAVFGTHTHIQTADDRILQNGTGYITDIGMTGVNDSVLGVEKSIIIKRMRDKLPSRFKNAEGEAQLHGVLFNIDPTTGKTVSVSRISE